MVDGRPHTVIETSLVTFGAGRPQTRCQLRDMETGQRSQRTFALDAKVEPADVRTRTLQFLGLDESGLTFMDASTGEQVSLSSETGGGAERWLSAGANCDVSWFSGRPICVDLPKFVTLQVVDIDGNTSGPSTKPATLSTGVLVDVPMSVQIDEWVTVDTTTEAFFECAVAP